MPEWAYVAMGSNMGDRKQYLAEALRRVASLPHTSVVAVSAVEETAPVGPVVQGNFLNQMLLLSTDLEPHALLAALLGIERGLGRTRGERWGPRTIDLDIVRFGDRVTMEPDLTLPHPELPHRDFWQRELAELAPHAR
jgi:2-amino-4-hydroxy-6-hydroxymethyldihydropteridine diphosphokinase